MDGVIPQWFYKECNNFQNAEIVLKQSHNVLLYLLNMLVQAFKCSLRGNKLFIFIYFFLSSQYNLFFSPEFSYPSSHLMAGVKRCRPRSVSTSEEVVNTPPAKWPGELFNLCHLNVMFDKKIKL